MAAFAFTILISINRSSWLMGIVFGLVVLWIMRPRKVIPRAQRTQIRMGMALLLLVAIIGLVLGSNEELRTA